MHRSRKCSIPGSPAFCIPREIGGYGLGFDAWFEAMRELSKADASHGWCAGLIIHHAHLIAQFPEAAQKTMWAEDLDVPIAASFAPNATAVAADGGYRVSTKGSPFASGVDHCSWVMLGGMAQDGPAPEWKFFLIPPGDYTIRDTWFTAGMRGTGSKTIVAENVFVPAGQVLRLADLNSAMNCQSSCRKWTPSWALTRWLRCRKSSTGDSGTGGAPDRKSRVESRGPEKQNAQPFG